MTKPTYEPVLSSSFHPTNTVLARKAQPSSSGTMYPHHPLQIKFTGLLQNRCMSCPVLGAERITPPSPCLPDMFLVRACLDKRRSSFLSGTLMAPLLSCCSLNPLGRWEALWALEVEPRPKRRGRVRSSKSSDESMWKNRSWMACKRGLIPSRGLQHLSAT